MSSRPRLTAPAGGPSRAAAAVCLVAAAWLPDAQAQGLVVTPSVTLVETVTNNRDLKGDDPQSDLITRVSPGLSLVSRRGAVQGSLVYSLNGLLHARESSLNSVYHLLSATGAASGFDGRLGVSANASANRQVISAYGTQGVDPSSNNANQAQVFSYGITPYFTGRLPGNITYRAQVAYNATQTNSSTVGDTSSMTASVRLGGRSGFIGWTVDGSRQIAETGDRPRSHNGSLGAGLTYQPDIDWQMAVRLGSEVDDLRSGRSERTGTWGVGLAWSPTPRTLVKLEVDERFYGRSHLLSLSHRMSRVVLSASDSRTLQTGGVAGRSTVSNYDLFFQQFASAEPDPTRRDALVRGFLAANGLDANAMVVAGGFLTGGPTVTRSRNLTSAYQGIRSTVTLSYVMTNTQTLGSGDSGGDLGASGRVRQRGLTLTWTHRFTPEASLLVTASGQRTPGDGLQPGNDLKSIAATWTTRLGQYTSVSLGLRHVSFDSESNPYTESALIGSLRMQF